VRVLSLLVVLVRSQPAPVTPETPARRPGALFDTAWLPRSCSSGDMV